MRQQGGRILTCWLGASDCSLFSWTHSLAVVACLCDFLLLVKHCLSAWKILISSIKDLLVIPLRRPCTSFDCILRQASPSYLSWHLSDVLKMHFCPLRTTSVNESRSFKKLNLLPQNCLVLAFKKHWKFMSHCPVQMSCFKTNQKILDIR